MVGVGDVTRGQIRLRFRIPSIKAVKYITLLLPTMHAAGRWELQQSAQVRECRSFEIPGESGSAKAGRACKARLFQLRQFHTEQLPGRARWRLTEMPNPKLPALRRGQ